VPEPDRPNEKLDVLGLLFEMSLDRAAHDLGQCGQWLLFIEL
jgi:hypothetical protein